jgi:DNA-binding transcriptional LysR family regulator
VRHPRRRQSPGEGPRSRTGLKLFNRERQGLAITEAGRDYLGVVRDAFDSIVLGTDRLLQRLHSGVITVSMSPDFAAKWLVSRLGRFAEAYPETELKVSATMHHVDFAREDVDLAIRHGAGDWAGLDAVNLCFEELFPVCSPALLHSDAAFIIRKTCCSFRYCIWTIAETGRDGSKRQAHREKGSCMARSSTTPAC